MKVLWGLMFNNTEHGAPPFPLCRGCYKHRLWSMSEVQWIFVKSVKCCDPGVKPALVWTSDSKSLTAASMFSVQSLPPTGCTVLSTFPKHFLHLQKTKEKNWEYTQRAALLHMYLVLLSHSSLRSPFSYLKTVLCGEQKSKRCGEVRLLCGLLVESTDRASVVYGAEIRSAAESASLSHFYLCLLQLRGLWQQTAFVSSVGPRSPRTWELNMNVTVGFYTEVLWESVSQDPLQSGLFGRSRLFFFFFSKEC